ncbi:MAG: hypothetical protein EF807_00730 [Candidatus Methanolliviera hydrocarbonicum]|uniref:Peptidyl-prolyl cis-trans isomerase n=1 Tax=Candidatus Methanolliviera hydrocarbonicum TaxID=2491085 RepID=A0A520KYR2_9EURY|nr:MAG: hypothetical protein EF807_00730 [Candidatus Methanolliviera hydrocarbonicum]
MASEKASRILVLFLIFIMVVSIVGYGFRPGGEEKTVERGDMVSIGYVWYLADGRVLDTNRSGVSEGKGTLPSVFIVGEAFKDTCLEGLDEELIGIGEGEEKKLQLNAYPLDSPKLTIPTKNFKTLPHEGDVIQMRIDYIPIVGIVTGVSEEGVNINCAYTLDVKVISIEKK